MNVDLLTTKLHIPQQRPPLVPRPHLWRQLDEGEGLGRKWTLISAPAGFGKTALLSSWAAQRDTAVAWLSLEASDNDPQQYWRYLFAALSQIRPPLTAEALAALRSPEPIAIRSLLTTLINQLAAVDLSLLLILDDYHLIDNVEIHQEMIFLLDHLPPQLHIYITTRSDPPFPLSRYRARGELVELRTADLRFLDAETAVFLNDNMQLNLPQTAVQALAERTEGWIAGLQLAALSLQKQPGDQADTFIGAFSGSHRYVLDYLTDEVLKDQPETIRHFLLETAVLDKLCGPLCDAVLETTQSQKMLEELEAANLFLFPLDDKREWFRFHHLFADLLRQRLYQQQPERVLRLHRRASRWYAAAGFANEAIHHAQAAGDAAWLVSLVERHILKAIFRSEFVWARQWIETIPAEKIQASPVLCLAQAWLSLRQHTVAQAERLVASAQSAQPASQQLTPNPVSGHIFTLQTILSRTRGEAPQRQIELAERALAVIPEAELGLRSMVAFRIGLGYLDLGAEDKVDTYCQQAVALGGQSGTTYAMCGAVYVQTIMALRRGELRETAVRCRQTFASMPEMEQQLPIAGVLPISLGQILLEWNELAEAEMLLRPGLTLTAGGGFKEAQIKGAYALARLQLARNQPNDLPDLVQMASPSSPDLFAYAAALQTQLHLIALKKTGEPHHLVTAVCWVEAQTFQIEDAPDADWRILAHLVHVRVNLAQHRAGQTVDLRPALHTIQQQIPFLKERGWRHFWLEALLVTALLWQSLGQEQEALAALTQALALAEAEGYRRIFLDEGQPMAQLLYAALEANIAPDFVGNLLAAFAAEAAPPPQQDLVEPLTEREIEVLHLIANGRTNREIGQQLSISLGTVKRHTANINGKLNVHNRTQAVAQARSLGILSDSFS